MISQQNILMQLNRKYFKISIRKRHIQMLKTYMFYTLYTLYISTFIKFYEKQIFLM